MTPLHTRTPPTIRADGKNYLIDVVATINGVQYRITAPIGDGRWFADIVWQRIVSPAIAPRVTDNRRVSPNAEA